jgi:hypothetical protein
MSGWRWQRGEISPGCIFGVIVLLIATFVGIKTVPVMMRVYEFSDEVSRVADKANTITWKDPKRMRDQLVRKAQELRLPVQPEAIKVTRTEKNLTIDVSYQVEIDYGVHTYVWRRVESQFRPLF